MTEPREPDYEAIMDDRAIERGEREMDRLDALYGRIEDWRKPVAEPSSKVARRETQDDA